MIPPPSQTLRSIGFVLQGAPQGDQFFNFGIRPEDLTITEPSRLTAQQTLGGAWADSFDIGVTTITLAGHNGWRGGVLSGEDLFAELRSTVFTAWHQGRADAIQQGQDPDTVQLFFADSLDSYAYLVAPRSFTLRRSKTSPLLMRYQIQLLCLAPADVPGDPIDEIVIAMSNPLRWLAASTGLLDIVNTILGLEAFALGALGAAAAAIHDFVGIGVALINSVALTAQAIVGQFTAVEFALLDVGQQFCNAAKNAFYVLSDDLTLTAEEILPIMGLANAFQDAACSMANGFNLIGVFPSWEAFRGASSCSSTGGGDPASVFTIQDVNPFVYAVAAAPPLVQVTADSQAAMDALQADPLQMAGQQAIVADLMMRTETGITVA